MSFLRYPSYKDSGVEWLGEVPEHWIFKPLWTLFKRIKRTGYKDEQLLSVYRDYGVIPKASRDDNNNKPSEDLTPYQLVRVGDLAINKMKAWQGSVAISEYQGIVSPAYFVYESTNDEVSKFLHYLMRSSRYIMGYLTLSKGIRVNQWDLEPQYHSRMPIALPPKEEQQTIAAFLDRETAKIDALIAEQQRLIELLKEKRQAVISHAVTKGLSTFLPSPSGGGVGGEGVPMKDSGIEWLGEVPEHWASHFKLNDLAQPERNSFVNGPFGSDLLTSELIQEGVPVIYIRDLKSNGYTRISEWCVTEEKAKQLNFCNILPGDILIAKVGDPPGLAVLYPADEPDGIITQDVIRIRVNKAMVDQGFLIFLLNSNYGRALIDNISVESTRTRVSLGEYKQLRMVVPPKEEQILITNFLNGETAKLDTLTNEAKNAITLLQERRTALISAAVTGKIDVRALVAEKS